MARDFNQLIQKLEAAKQKQSEMIAAGNVVRGGINGVSPMVVTNPRVHTGGGSSATIQRERSTNVR